MIFSPFFRTPPPRIPAPALAPAPRYQPFPPRPNKARGEANTGHAEGPVRRGEDTRRRRARRGRPRGAPGRAPGRATERTNWVRGQRAEDSEPAAGDRRGNGGGGSPPGGPRRRPPRRRGRRRAGPGGPPPGRPPTGSARETRPRRPSGSLRLSVLLSLSLPRPASQPASQPAALSLYSVHPSLPPRLSVSLCVGPSYPLPPRRPRPMFAPCARPTPLCSPRRPRAGDVTLVCRHVPGTGRRARPWDGT